MTCNGKLDRFPAYIQSCWKLMHTYLSKYITKCEASLTLEKENGTGQTGFNKYIERQLRSHQEAIFWILRHLYVKKCVPRVVFVNTTSPTKCRRRKDWNTTKEQYPNNKKIIFFPTVFEQYLNQPKDIHPELNTSQFTYYRFVRNFYRDYASERNMIAGSVNTTNDEENILIGFCTNLGAYFKKRHSWPSS